MRAAAAFIALFLAGCATDPVTEIDSQVASSRWTRGMERPLLGMTINWTDPNCIDIALAKLTLLRARGRDGRIVVFRLTNGAWHAVVRTDDGRILDNLGRSPRSWIEPSTAGWFELDPQFVVRWSITTTNQDQARSLGTAHPGSR